MNSDSRPRDVLLGIDVGGTFTDIFVVDQKSGTCSVHKVPSTRGREADGFINGVTTGVPDLSSIAAVIHGTTVGTNALLERKGAKTGLVTTQGFRDVLQMRRRDRPTTWGLRGRYEPIVQRSMSYEVPERVLADGTMQTPVDEAALRSTLQELLAKDAQSVALVFINAYANTANEERARAILEAVWPNEHFSISSELLPEIREFERASTTALNAYLQPVVGSYLKTLDQRLAEGGFTGEFLIVQSNGGVMTSHEAAGLPVRTALSGPAAGVFAAAYLAGQSGFDNVITCDMGGTSFDVSVIADGEATLSAQTSVDFGLIIRSPMIEITTIGAGGGSIAWIDAGGLIRIGPESAGSDPGPVCYGRDNDRPTVTDANVVLGRINAEQPIGGQLKRLDKEAAEETIRTHIGEPLGMTALAAAEAIIEVANARMAGAIRLVSIERGHDPREFAAMPFGGGGSLHACALVREIGLGRALVPRYPGIVSALGCVIADMRQDFVQTINQPLSTADKEQLTEAMQTFSQTGIQRLENADAKFSSIDTRVSVDMLYTGQTHTVDVQLETDRPDSFDRQSILQAFERRYRETYGRVLDAVEPIIVNLRVTVIGRRPKFDPRVLAPSGDASLDVARAGSRPVYFAGAMHDAAVYRRLDLPVAAVVHGPAVLEQPDTTIWIEPGFQARVDALGNLVVNRENAT